MLESIKAPNILMKDNCLNGDQLSKATASLQLIRHAQAMFTIQNAHKIISLTVFFDYHMDDTLLFCYVEITHQSTISTMKFTIFLAIV